MAENKFYSPFKVGLLIVTLAYFLFTFHAMFTLSWIGEWAPLPGIRGFIIFVEDIGGTIGLVFRFAASIVALGGLLYYFAKKGLPEQTARKILRVILIAEAIYWLGLLPSGFMPLIYLKNFDIPALIESTATPIALLVLALKLSPKKPIKQAIKWGLITGTVYIFVFWLVNTGIWML